VLIVELHVGDSVAVKSGVLDPDFGIDISGWQGRIEEIDNGETVFIRWDSITLQKMNLDIIIRCENENFDWQVMTLHMDEIEITTERDSEADVLLIVNQLRLKIIDDPRLNAEQDA
jgi:hypothetical protein